MMLPQVKIKRIIRILIMYLLSVPTVSISHISSSSTSKDTKLVIRVASIKMNNVETLIKSYTLNKYKVVWTCFIDRLQNDFK